MAIAQQPTTLEEFLRLPEEKPELEFQDGAVTQKVSPKGKHSTLRGELYDRFNRFARPSRLARAYAELRTTFAGASVVPDVSVFLWDRIPRTPTGQVADDFLQPPDVAIEIVSAEQGVNSLVRRCLWYVDNGVRVALLVDPQDESVLVFRPDSRPNPQAAGDQIDLGEVLPGFQLSVEELFASLSA